MIWSVRSSISFRTRIPDAYRSFGPSSSSKGWYSTMTVAHDYLNDVVWRARKPMEPLEHHVAWEDRPRAQKFYPETSSIDLHQWSAPSVPASSSDSALSIGEFSGMLLGSYAMVDRRLTVYANSDVDSLPEYWSAAWSRGAASGGARYPVSIYWVVGPGCDLLPGVYFYSPDQHCLRLLLSGDVTDQVAAALGRPESVRDQYLLLGIKFWQNSYKYNSFAYHAVSMDTGTALESFRFYLGDGANRLEPRFWFDEAAIAELLNVDPLRDEAVFCVVEIGGATRRTRLADNQALPSSRVPFADKEFSTKVTYFEVLLELQSTMGVSPGESPDAVAVSRAVASRYKGTGILIPLPQPSPLLKDSAEVLTARRSSFGRFSSARSMEPTDLAYLLSEGALAGLLNCDVLLPTAENNPLELFVFVNHVSGVAPGAYRYDQAAGALEQINRGVDDGFLQRNYFLENYNPEQAGAVIVPAIRTKAFLDEIGPRGYRVANTIIGMATQRIYEAATSIDVGCGAALGFDNVSYMERLEIDGGDLVPLIMMMVGSERPGSAAYRYEIL